MNVTIIVFSPTGNTLKVAKKIKEQAKKEINVQILDISGEKEIFLEKNIKSFLEKNVLEHNVLMIGTPVYAHHVQYHVINLIKNLPSLNRKWGKYAVPFVTFGDVSSGIALHEAAKLLQRSGRKIIGGLRITAEHTFTRLLNSVLNQGKPDNEINSIINDFWNTILERYENKVDKKMIIKSMNYQSLKERIKAHVIFREKIWQKYLYPRISIIHSKCTECGICVKNCPVNHLIMEKGKVVEGKISECITCGKCVVNCKLNALEMTGKIGITDKIDKFEEMIKNVKSGNSPIASNEYPKNKLF
ncbi:MAG: EFR1 family ferrodoxin [Bacteroidales bacterium]|nr:EFR1 family ferrodoxin [Bacteroidales bacterium]